MARKVRFFHDQVEKAGLATGIRPMLDKALDMDELEVCAARAVWGRRRALRRRRRFFCAPPPPPPPPPKAPIA